MLLLVVDLLDGHHDVEQAVEQPENVVDVVALLDELWTVFPEADVVQVERVVGKEVQTQGQVVQNLVQDHALRTYLVLGQVVPNVDD